MRNYQPNFSDPRVLTRVKKALTTVEQYTKSKRKSWISSKELYKHFGNTSRPLGKYLKEMLLTVADPYYNSETGICIKYTRNDEGFKQVMQLAGIDPNQYTISPELEQQLDTGDIDYNAKSDRLYNPLQYIPKQVRGSIMANKGYKYHYDIEAAAPNLLVQHAKKINPQLSVPNLDHYNQNRKQVREQIALACGISSEQVKSVINGVLQGGVVSCWQAGKVFQCLDYSYNAVTNLRHDQTYQGIQKDISKLWKTLKSEFPQRYLTDKNGITRSQRLSSKEKSKLYRELESEVGGVIRRLLKKRKIKCLWIHDGWCSDGFIDPLDVELEVKRLTGYSIKLEWNKYEDI